MTDHAPQSEQDVRTRDLDADSLDTWLALNQDGTVTAYAGKVELGTGIRTALTQIVAEELDIAPANVHLEFGDTATTPDQGVTAGSKTIQVAGTALRHAAAGARAAILDRASRLLEVPPDRLATANGTVAIEGAGEPAIPYHDLISGRFDRRLDGDVAPKDASRHTVVGTSMPRLDLPAKVTGGRAFIHDIEFDGMWHARMIRPPLRTPHGTGSHLIDVDPSTIADLPEVKIVRNGDFLGVVAAREETAVAAASRLAVTWSEPPLLPPMNRIWDDLRAAPAEIVEIVREGNIDAAFTDGVVQHNASFEHAWHAHASLGPSCSVADVREDRATIWSSSQGVYPLRPAIAELLGMPVEGVRIVFAEGAGCYGQNGADDVSADAAVLSQAIGRPVRLQWSRQDEFAWEPKGPAMASTLRGAVDADGKIVAWEHDVWTPTHAARPAGEPSRLLAGQQVDPPFPPAPYRNVGGDRNAPTTYTVPHQVVRMHWVQPSPLRQSSFRTLGGLHNSTANEIFIDELAHLAGADPLAFRIRHLDDPRAVAVMEEVGRLARWKSPRQEDHERTIRRGRGVAFTRYETEYAYVATVADVTVDPRSGEIRVTRVYVAHDCGLIINPDGLRNQIEGNVIQAISRGLKEEVTWDGHAVTSLTYATYPILTFREVPEVEISLIDRQDEPAWGAGEPATCPTIAAVNNAVFDATGIRLRRVPYTPQRVLAALAERQA